MSIRSRLINRYANGLSSFCVSVKSNGRALFGYVCNREAAELVYADLASGVGRLVTRFCMYPITVFSHLGFCVMAYVYVRYDDTGKVGKLTDESACLRKAPRNSKSVTASVPLNEDTRLCIVEPIRTDSSDLLSVTVM